MWGGWRVSPNKTGGITIALYESCTTRPWGHLSYFTLFPDPIWLNLFIEFCFSKQKWNIYLTAWPDIVKVTLWCFLCWCSQRIFLMSLLWSLLFAAAASLVVKVYPERVLATQGGPVTLRCQVSGSPPHYFHWSREDGRPISHSTDRRRQGTAHMSTTWPQLV